MSRYENAITTLQARTIVSAIVAFHGSLATCEGIEKAAVSIVDNLISLFPSQFPVENKLSFLAFALSSCAKEGIKRNELTILDYLSMLADIKQANEENINTADIISKKFGVVEVGHNGKTLSFGTMFDYMDGEYTSVVYGVFSDEDKKAVYELVHNKQYEKAIDYISNYCGYWSDKYAFQNDMDNLTRGKGITAKGANIQVVYNEGKYNAFINALEDGKIESLADALK